MSYLTEIYLQIEELYKNLEALQSQWYENSKFTCPSGCGSCCHNFEPDLMECEAIFMAKWLVDNRPEIAKSLAEDNFLPLYKTTYETVSHASYSNQEISDKTCIFFNPESEYHCSIYGGRPFICRLFGASSTKDKNNEIVWRPCKFYPLEKLQQYNKILVHKTYGKNEAEKILKVLPPVMSDIMEQSVSILPDGTQTFPLREILPKIIMKTLFEKQLQD